MGTRTMDVASETERRSYVLVFVRKSCGTMNCEVRIDLLIYVPKKEREMKWVK